MVSTIGSDFSQLNSGVLDPALFSDHYAPINCVPPPTWGIRGGKVGHWSHNFSPRVGPVLINERSKVDFVVRR